MMHPVSAAAPAAPAIAQGCRINIGCGPAPTPGYINYDNNILVVLARVPGAMGLLRTLGALQTEHYDQRQFGRTVREYGVRWANCSRHIPLPDATVRVAYCSHMYEHLDRNEARRFLAEVARALMPGGWLRLLVPDLRLFVDSYLQNGDADWFIDRLRVSVPNPATLAGRVRRAVVGQRHHLWMYDRTSIVKSLEQAGCFDRVSVLPPGRTNIDDIGGIDLCEREDESIYVEARKRP